jgi:hypothetical protein
MQKVEVTYLQMVLIGMGVGAVLGLIPLALGIYKRKKKLAFWGFIISAAAGAIWSLLALVPVIVFSVLIFRAPKAAAAAQENSLDISAEQSENL